METEQYFDNDVELNTENLTTDILTYYIEYLFHQ